MNENVDQSSQAGRPEADVRLADVFSCDRIRLNVQRSKASDVYLNSLQNFLQIPASM